MTAIAANTDVNSPQAMGRLGLHDRVLSLVDKFDPNSSRFVDLAAGEGALTVRLLERGHDVVPVDAFDENWKLAGVPLSVQNLDAEFAEPMLAQDNRKFDAIAAVEIIEHLENPFRFARECAKLLRSGGHLYLTTPNVESAFSRLIFLYTGRLNSFGAYETVRPAHITPIFGWKLEMLLDEAGFEVIHEEFDYETFGADANLKVRSVHKISKIVARFIKGNGGKGGSGRILVARLK